MSTVRRFREAGWFWLFTTPAASRFTGTPSTNAMMGVTIGDFGGPSSMAPFVRIH